MLQTLHGWATTSQNWGTGFTIYSTDEHKTIPPRLLSPTQCFVRHDERFHTVAECSFALPSPITTWFTPSIPIDLVLFLRSQAIELLLLYCQLNHLLQLVFAQPPERFLQLGDLR